MDFGLGSSIGSGRRLVQPKRAPRGRPRVRIARLVYLRLSIAREDTVPFLRVVLHETLGGFIAASVIGGYILGSLRPSDWLALLPVDSETSRVIVSYITFSRLERRELEGIYYGTL